MEVIESRTYENAGTTCRRTILQDGVNFGVVFTSDKESRGRALTNVFEDLAAATLSELKASPDQVRWYEHKVGERTADGIPQTPCFDPVEFGELTPLGSPVWGSLEDDSFGQEVAAIIGRQK